MKKIYSLALVMCLLSVGIAYAGGSCNLAFGRDMFASEEDYNQMVTYCNSFTSSETCEDVGNEGFCVWEQGETVYTPIKDAKVSSSMPCSNFGLGRYALVNDKSWAKDRFYLGFDLSSIESSSVNSAVLRIPVYYTGSQVVGSVIQSWYCGGYDFVETTITWRNQPFNLGCSMVSTYTVPSVVIAGNPETWHEYDLTSVVNSELTKDKKFIIVLKHDVENGVNNYRYVQYLTKDYPEAEFRPQLVVS